MCMTDETLLEGHSSCSGIFVACYLEVLTELGTLCKVGIHIPEYLPDGYV
jgi:hypothetical protein